MVRVACSGCFVPASHSARALLMKSSSSEPKSMTSARGFRVAGLLWEGRPWRECSSKRCGLGKWSGECESGALPATTNEGGGAKNFAWAVRTNQAAEPRKVRKRATHTHTHTHTDDKQSDVVSG